MHTQVMYFRFLSFLNFCFLIITMKKEERHKEFVPLPLYCSAHSFTDYLTFDVGLMSNAEESLKLLIMFNQFYLFENSFLIDINILFCL